MYVQVLYADTLFLSNFVMNLLALSLTGSLLHLPKRRGRATLSAALGGVYATLAVILAFPSPLHIASSLLLSALLLLITFGSPHGKGLFVRNYLLFYFSCILLGGAVEAFFSLLAGAFGVTPPSAPSTADVVLLLGFLSFFLLRAVFRFLDGGGLPRTVPVRISFLGKSVTLSLLVDSGCLLSDPITGKGALLVSLAALRGILPREILGCASTAGVQMPTDSVFAKRCRLLPAEGIGGRRLLLAFRADGVTLLSDGEELDVLIALYTGDGERFGGCRGLFPASLLFARGTRTRPSKLTERNGYDPR